MPSCREGALSDGLSSSAAADQKKQALEPGLLSIRDNARPGAPGRSNPSTAGAFQPRPFLPLLDARYMDLMTFSIDRIIDRFKFSQEAAPSVASGDDQVHGLIDIVENRSRPSLGSNSECFCIKPPVGKPEIPPVLSDGIGSGNVFIDGRPGAAAQILLASPGRGT
jgi:hypothetical protein